MANINRYAQISETLIDHPKTTRAIRILRMNRFQFVGHLACLWNWTMKNAPDGELTRFTARDIADAARVTDPDDFDADADESAGKFLRALLDCRTSDGGAGFLEMIDGDLLVHDWEEFGGKYHKKRVKNAGRMRVSRARAEGENSDSPQPDDCATHVQRTESESALHVPDTSRAERSGAERSRAERNGAEQNDDPLPPAPDEPTGSLDDTEHGRRRSSDFGVYVENILCECDRIPARAHWRAALAADEAAAAARGEIIRNPGARRKDRLDRWIRDPASRPLPPAPPGSPSSRRLTASEERSARINAKVAAEYDDFLEKLDAATLTPPPLQIAQGGSL
jgi:hypothetical protein